MTQQKYDKEKKEEK